MKNNFGARVSSLAKVQGKQMAEQLAVEPVRPMTVIGDQRPSKNVRSVVIAKDQILNKLSPTESFEVVVEKIAKVIKNNRIEVENALIATGSPKMVRTLGRKRFNSKVQNKLAERSESGQAFRNYMTVLVGTLYGTSLVNDGFFRSETEEKSGSTGIMPGAYATQNMFQQSAMGNSPIGLTATNDGGVESSGQDWGSILQGSAQVINSLGGVIGLFTGGNQSTSEENVFNQYNPLADIQAQQEEERKRKNRNTLMWVGGILVVLVGGYLIWKNRQN
jgi:hypothetical protein